MQNATVASDATEVIEANMLIALGMVFVVVSVLGHEAVLEVVAHRRGEGSSLAVGQRVTFSVADVCGNCERCQSGLSQKCFSLFKVYVTIL